MINRALQLFIILSELRLLSRVLHFGWKWLFGFLQLIFLPKIFWIKWRIHFIDFFGSSHIPWMNIMLVCFKKLSTIKFKVILSLEKCNRIQLELNEKQRITNVEYESYWIIMKLNVFDERIKSQQISRHCWIAYDVLRNRGKNTRTLLQREEPSNQRIIQKSIATAAIHKTRTVPYSYTHWHIHTHSCTRTHLKYLFYFMKHFSFTSKYIKICGIWFSSQLWC